MRLFLKNSITFALPLLLFFAIPIITFYTYDPFKILNKYDTFNNSIVSYNEDYIATERFIKNKDQYHSYIFGSSRAGCGFQVKDWESILNESGTAYSFTASNESIFGILGKLRLINKEKANLKNALLVFDTDITFKKIVNSKGHLYIKHPLVSGESEEAFISEYLKDYIFSGFFISYLDYKIFHTQRDYMKGYLDFEHQDTKELYKAFDLSKKEAQILENEAEYYNGKNNIFYDRPLEEAVADDKIAPIVKTYLKEIKAILDSNQTNYKIIISPLYDQKRMSTNDLNSLRAIFGIEAVYNYSGKNSITDNKHNYYETSHYKTTNGKEILEQIYASKNSPQ